MEKIRRALRRRLGWDSWAYRRGAGLLKLTILLHSEGLVTTLALRRLSKAIGGPDEALRFARLEHHFWIRPGTKDTTVAINNFVREEYHAGLGMLDDPRVLVDAGAYIGGTPAYFLSRYPRLRSIALEPMADSMTQARTNLAANGWTATRHRNIYFCRKA